jgi:ADP-ribose pyrophosphatase YjhB (NUDIX family)
MGVLADVVETHFPQLQTFFDRPQRQLRCHRTSLHSMANRELNLPTSVEEALDL